MALDTIRAFAVAGTIVTLATSAEAQPPEKFADGAAWADASWDISDACGNTFADVQPYDMTLNKVPAESFTYIYIFRIDECDATKSMFISKRQDLADGDFFVDQTGRSAILDIETSAYDYYRSIEVGVKIHLSWSASGALQVNSSNYHSSDSGAPYMYRSHGKGRTGTATGIYSVGSLNVPQSSSFAFVSRYSNVIMAHPRP
jgi:hypothetical protein